MKKLFLIITPLVLLSACSSYKKALYLRDDEVLEMVNQKGILYEYHIMPKDELTIIVSTSDPEVSAPFYRKIGQSKLQSNNTGQSYNNAKLLDYLVDNDGYIDFPILGKLHVVGLTNRECEDLIRQKLQPYLNEVPNVTVRTLSYTVSVLGEVNRPGTYTVTDERITIFEALAQAGDMTLFGATYYYIAAIAFLFVTLVFAVLRGLRSRRETYMLILNYQTKEGLEEEIRRVLHNYKAKVRSNTLSSNSSFWISLTSLAATIASLIIIAIR